MVVIIFIVVIVFITVIRSLMAKAKIIEGEEDKDDTGNLTEEWKN